jgi:hypothetical protein
MQLALSGDNIDGSSISVSFVASPDCGESILSSVPDRTLPSPM